MIQNDYLMNVDRLKQFGKQPLIPNYQLRTVTLQTPAIFNSATLRNISPVFQLKILTDFSFIAIFVFPGHHDAAE